MEAYCSKNDVNGAVVLQYVNERQSTMLIQGHQATCLKRPVMLSPLLLFVVVTNPRDAQYAPQNRREGVTFAFPDFSGRKNAFPPHFKG